MIQKITVKGLVQGIGYRPFVAELAEELHVNGWVRNTAGVVTILADAEKPVLEIFQTRLVSDAPIGSVVESLDVEDGTEFGPQDAFCIIMSEDAKATALPRIPADLATCDCCYKEMHDQTNRRFRHPFISCVSCGPRYSILHALPYDRDQITMREFVLCDDCKREYTKKGDVRRHAQTIACKKCGPRLAFQEVETSACGVDENAFYEAVRILKAGGIVAVKDIGGYHLACLPTIENTLKALRLAKGREKKPFALMYADVSAVQKDCIINEQEANELRSVARPIVLCKRKKAIYDTCEMLICGDSPDIGAMLPCNPLQTMLSEALGTLIMTSANAPGEPMIIDDGRMKEWLLQAKKRIGEAVSGGELAEPVLLGMLSHEREILVPLDDSVVRIVRERRQFVRRSRGYVPEPITIHAATKSSATVLAMGGDLKATLAFARENQVVLSGQMGDLEDLDCYEAYGQERKRLQKLLMITPTMVVTDLHPAYRSAQLGKTLCEKSIALQHHMAHALAVIAEHRLMGDAICVTMDGTGYGVDATIWGGEIFLWKDSQMTRTGHLRTQVLPGGDAGAKNAKSVAYAFLAGISESNTIHWDAFWKRATWLSKDEYELVKAAMQMQIHVAHSSSTGRLFDAVSAVLGICLYNDYEGEAAMELEYAATRKIASLKEPLLLPCSVEGDCLVGDTSALLEQIVERISQGEEIFAIASGFIDALVEFIYDEVVWQANKSNTQQVTLSGGTFLNRLLSERTIDRLEGAGYQVYMNEQVPTGDGGIALGQAYWALLNSES